MEILLISCNTWYTRLKLFLGKGPVVRGAFVRNYATLYDFGSSLSLSSSFHPSISAPPPADFGWRNGKMRECVTGRLTERKGNGCAERRGLGCVKSPGELARRNSCNFATYIKTFRSTLYVAEESWNSWGLPRNGREYITFLPRPHSEQGFRGERTKRSLSVRLSDCPFDRLTERTEPVPSWLTRGHLAIERYAATSFWWNWRDGIRDHPFKTSAVRGEGGISANVDKVWDVVRIFTIDMGTGPKKIHKFCWRHVWTVPGDFEAASGGPTPIRVPCFNLHRV